MASRRDDDRRPIGRGEVEEQGIDESARADRGRGSNDQARNRDQHDVFQNQRDDLGRLGPERHADADLIAPSSYCVGHHPIQAERREQ